MAAKFFTGLPLDGPDPECVGGEGELALVGAVAAALYPEAGAWTTPSRQRCRHAPVTFTAASSRSMWALLLPVAYLIGTFPSAVLVARANGIDIRTVGFGQPGRLQRHSCARLAQGRVGVPPRRHSRAPLAAGPGSAVGGRPGGYALGAAAVIGHVFPVWHRFRGGKGVAMGGACRGGAVTGRLLALLVWCGSCSQDHR